jgi:hypothetical protein
MENPWPAVSGVETESDVITRASSVNNVAADLDREVRESLWHDQRQIYRVIVVIYRTSCRSDNVEGVLSTRRISLCSKRGIEGNLLRESGRGAGKKRARE